MKRAFSLIELLIVVAILGILAAVVIPYFQGHAQKAKEATAKENLWVLRNVIELYALRHNGVPPGYFNDDPTASVSGALVSVKLINQKYLKAIPTNPFNQLKTVKTLYNWEEFPAEAKGTYGWIYKPQTKIIRLDWPGADSAGVLYFEY